ncbi:uncharacterized protein LOC132752111 isoform X2 [Ruditapes philippinarum]|uniref:uncharacterized protein LOC132752111 isoform X2 n=1 Tax=Ruditapes philippinarum TaxID=129788 RepID=UPI00295C08DF|nr:uncharacterized protein LOC132752111 isoform X2 [Ruditapes philippinarum]
MCFLHLLTFIILLFLYESQSLQEGFCGNVVKTSVLRICTEDRMQDATTAYIDTIEAPKFKNTSCECRIFPSRNRASLMFEMINITQGSQLKFKIKGNVFDKLSSSRSVRIQENTKLKFITNTTRKQEGACLAIYQKNRNPRQEVKFSIRCKKVASRATTIETMPVSNSASQVPGIMAPLSSNSKSHTLSTKKSSAQTKVGLDSTDNRRIGILGIF